MRVAVIGAGPAGLMAAGMAGQSGSQVDLFDGNEKAGKKLYITGKGRCNVTNYIEPNEFLNNIVSNPKFMFSSIYSFSPFDTYEFFENNGVKLKVERGNRVFPVSDKASDITKALEIFCKKNGVNFLYGNKVVSIKKNDKFTIYTTCGTYNNYDCTILCTGGMSYSPTGSDGSGYSIAKQLGHSIIELKPALVPIILNNDFIKRLEGLSLKNVLLKTIYDGHQKDFFGEMIFTRNGISGPIVLSASSYLNRAKNVELSLDLKPALTTQQLENRLKREFEKFYNNEIATVIRTLMPKSLSEVFLEICNISKDRKVKTINSQEIKKIISCLKHFELKYKTLESIEFGIVTAGGIDTKEINPKTMESKFVKNLYFAGEIIDVDALTGGFNIQIALSTGYVAGKIL